MNNDLISRDALKKYARVVFDKDLGRLRVVDVSDIDNAPAVSFMISPDYVTELQNRNKELIKQLEEAERPQGEWELSSIQVVGENWYKCSICGRKIRTSTYHLKEYPFCHCGAKMKGD